MLSPQSGKMLNPGDHVGWTSSIILHKKWWEYGKLLGNKILMNLYDLKNHATVKPISVEQQKWVKEIIEKSLT